MADVIVVNKVDTASFEAVSKARSVVAALNPRAIVVEAASPILVEGGERIRGKRVLCVEDGPTVTHGEMPFGAGYIAAQRWGAAEIVDPRPWAVGSIRETFEKYPTTGKVLPAMGYGSVQTRELAETIRATPADVVVIATPIDLRRLIEIDKTALRVRYELQEIGEPTLGPILRERLRTREAEFVRGG
jgi:predicted GTPase